MNKKTFLLSTLAGTVLASGLAVPRSFAIPANSTIINEDQKIIALELPTGESNLSKDKLATLITQKYAANGISVSPEFLDDSIATGSTIRVNNIDFNLVLFGDVDKNGSVSITDAQNIASSLLDNPLQGPQKLAADLTGDSSISISDAQRIKHFLLDPASYSDSGYSEFNPDLVDLIQVQSESAYITSVEVTWSATGSNVVVKLNKAVEGATIQIGTTTYSGAKASSGYTTYEIPQVKDLEVGKTYTLTVKDKSGNVVGTKDFTVRLLLQPTNISIPMMPTNPKNTINSSNVSNAIILGHFNSGNAVAVTLVVEVKDTDNTTLTFNAPVEAHQSDVYITGANLSSLKDGDLTVKAYVLDEQGNKSAPCTTVEGTSDNKIKKSAEVPTIQVARVDRTATGAATVYLRKSENTTAIYCLVKLETEPAPTREEILAKGAKSIGTTVTQFTVGEDDGPSAKGDGLTQNEKYKLYMIAGDMTNGGVFNENIVTTTIPKANLTKLPNVAPTNINAEEEPGVYTWTYDEQNNPAVIGYRVILKDDYNGSNNNANKIIAIKEFSLEDEKRVNFFEELKKQSADGQQHIYKISIVAIGDGNTRSDSLMDNATEMTLDELPPVVTGLNLSFDTSSRSLLKWTETTGTSDVKDYTLEVYKYDKNHLRR